MAGKRKQEEEKDQQSQEQKQKRMKTEQEEKERRATQMRKKTFDDWLKFMRKETEGMYQRLYGSEWEQRMNAAMETSMKSSDVA